MHGIVNSYKHEMFSFYVYIYYLAMNNVYFISGVISLIYFIIKVIELRFNNSNTDESKPFKPIFKETVLVYTSCLVGFYLITQFEEKNEKLFSKDVPVFTSNADF